MDFGSLQIATLWRLTKDGVVRRAVVVDGDRPRLVIVEADAIVQWERFAITAELRKRAVELQRDLRKRGWVDAEAAQ